MKRPGTLRLAAFAFGDFAFNLYWQSVMLYLLFYYTDALAIGMELAAAIYLAASVWDGVASFVVGVIADRRGSARHYRLALLIGAAPLGLAFVIAYMPPPVAGVAGVAFVLGGHLLFRTAYALVNVPYLAMSARISADSRDRALVAGLRMLAGTGAAVVVAMGTVPVGTMLAGIAGPRAYLFAAMLFAAVATVILLYVGATFRDAAPVDDAPRPSVLACLSSLARNHAFVTLAGAMMAMIVAVTILNKSVLYFFKYAVRDEAAGQLALAAMMATSAVAVPLWMLIARFTGARAVWFIASGACAGGLLLFAGLGIAAAHPMQVLLIGLQVAIVGLHFAFWALLPDTIEWGQRDTGLRVEGMVFGLAALLQRVAIGVATVILGIGFGSSGYTANVAQGSATLAGMRATIALAPLAFLALSAWLMWLNPMRKGAHDRIVAELEA
ncbi:MFS transporter [Sphingomonas sp. SUN019]|uniref:MFS transporter n=1 Tax=Sphingomonas sp. SUN019 TaxID=2937788 RepID=UPI0021642F1E|nr:MFS transporter [Sphingomonas sp. SUN019]UVO50855.1 MFS transporter [Sphingomonas sp. SUN019]